MNKINSVEILMPDYYQTNSDNNLDIKPKSSNNNGVEISIPTLDESLDYTRNEGGLKQFNPDEYSKILGKLNVNPNLPIEELNEYRALQQSGGRLFGNALAQTGTTLVGGTISGIGALASLPRAAYAWIRGIWDENADEKWDQAVNKGLSGWLMQQGHSVENWGRDVAPIYQTRRAMEGGFAGGLGDATWWATHAPTIASAVASMAPVVGSLKLTSMIGTALKAANTANKLGKAASTVGKFLTNNKFQTILGTIQGAHLDTFMEVAHGWQEQYDLAKSLGYSDDDANRYASIYASEAYKDGIGYGLIFNAIEMHALLKGMNTSPATAAHIEKGIKRNIQELINKGSKATLDPNDVTKMTGLDKLFSAGNKLTDFLQVTLGEGLEEMRVDFALKQGEDAAKDYFGIEHANKNKSSIDKLGEMVRDANAWDSFIWGAIGGGVLAGGRSVIDKVLNGKTQQEYEQKRANNIINTVQSVARLLEDSNGDMNIRISSKPRKDVNGQPILDKNGVQIEDLVLEDPFSKIAPIMIECIGDTRAYEYIESYLKGISDLNADEQTELFGSDKSEVIDSLRREFGLMAKHIENAKKHSWGSEYDKIGHIQIATQDYMYDYYKRQLQIIDTALAEHNINNDAELKALEKLNPKRHAIESKISELKEALKTRDKVIADIDSEIKTLNRQRGALKGVVTKAKSKISNYQQLIDNIDNRISYLEAQNDQSANEAFVRSKDEGTQLDLFTDSIIDNTEEITSLKTRRLELEKSIDKANQLIRDKEATIQFVDSTISNKQSHRNHHDTQRNITNDNLGQWKTQLSELLSEKDAINNEYDAKRNSIRQKYDRFNLEEAGLNELREMMYKNIMDVEAMIETRNEDIPTKLKQYADQIEEDNKAQKKLEEEQRAAEKREKELQRLKEKQKRAADRKEKKTNGETVEEVVDEDDDSRIVKSNKDDNGIEYTSSLNNGVKSVKISNRYINIGTILNVAESPKKVESIEVLDINGKSVVTIKFENDEETYTAKELNDADVTIADSSTQSIRERLSEYDSEYSSHPALDSDGNRERGAKIFIDKLINDFFNGQAEIDKSSELYRLLSSDPKDLNTIERMKKFIISLDNKLKSVEDLDYKKHDIMEIRSTLKTLRILLDKYENQARIREFIDNLFDRTQFVIPNGSDSNIDSLIDKTISDLTESLVDKIYIDNKRLRFNKDINIEDTGKLLANIYNRIQTLKQQIAAQSNDQVYTDQAFNALDGAYNKLYDVLKETYKSYAFKAATNAQVSNKLKHLLKVLNDSTSAIHTLYNNNPQVKSFIEHMRDYAKEIDSILEDMLESKPITSERLNKLLEYYNDLSSFVNVTTATEFATVFNRLNPNNTISSTEAQVIWNETGDLLRSIIAVHAPMDVYKVVTEGILSAFDREIPFAINVFTNSTFVEAIEEFSDEEVDPNVARQFSENQQEVIKYLNKILTGIVENEFYKADAKIPFEAIIDYIFQQPNGAENIGKVASNLFDILHILLNPDNQLTIENIFNKSNIDKDDVLYVAYKNIVNNVSLDDVGLEFRDRLGSLKNSYITNFTQTHKVRSFEALTHKGLRRLTPNIYETLSNDKVYNYKHKKFETNEITHYGETFTPKEIINTLKSLAEGQIVNITENQDGTGILIYVNVGKKKLVLDEVGFKDSDQYGGFSLIKQSEKGTIYYESAFGTWNGTNTVLSNECNNLVKALTKNEACFSAAKEFYKLYTKYRTEGSIEEHADELTSILNELTEDDKTSPLFNAIKAMIQYGSDITTEPIKEADLEKCYTILSPPFYALREDMLDHIKRHSLKIPAAYNNLNRKLFSDFNEMQKLLKSYKKGTREIVISSINKSPISYADNKTVGNINDEVEKTTTLNGEPVVDIVIKQKVNELGTIQSISSLTRNEIVTGSHTDKISGNDHHWQIYTQIRSNSGVNGYSLIPTIRGTLNGTSDYHDQAQNLVTSILDDVLQNPFATKLTSEVKNNMYDPKMSDSELKEHNDAFYAKMISLGEHVIMDLEHKKDGTASYFNVSPLFENKDTKGRKYYKKVVEFITSVPAKDIAKHRSISFSNKIECIYDENGKLKSITTYRQKIDTNTLKIKNRRNAIFNKRTEHLKLIDKFKFKEEDIKIGDKLGFTYNIDVTSASNTDFKKLLKEVFVKHMLRSVNTYINEDTKAITYGKKVIKEDKATYEPIDLSKPYKPFDNSDEYASYQDFLIETGAILSPMVGIKSENGETLTNYEIDSIPPAMYFETIDSYETENPDQLENDNNTQARDLIKSIIENTNAEGKSINWFKQLGDNQADVIAGLKKLGIIPRNTSIGVAKIVYDWLNDLYGSEANGNIQYMDESDLNIETGVETQEGQTSIKIMNYHVKEKQIRVNPNVLSNPYVTSRVLGGTFLHESIHKHMYEKMTVEERKEIRDKLSNIYNPIAEDISNMSLEDFNNKYKSDLTDKEYNTLKAYNEAFKADTDELVTRALTDDSVANIFNRIKTNTDVNVKTEKSFWRTLIETLLKFIGLNKLNNKSLEANIINTFINQINDAKGITNAETNAKTAPVVGDQPTSLPAVTKVTSESNSSKSATKSRIAKRRKFNEVVITETADREMGYTPALATAENSVGNLLNFDKKLVSFDTKLVNDFKTKYYDDTNSKIC